MRDPRYSLEYQSVPVFIRLSDRFMSLNDTPKGPSPRASSPKPKKIHHFPGEAEIPRKIGSGRKPTAITPFSRWRLVLKGDISRKAAADEIGVSIQTIAKLENVSPTYVRVRPLIWIRLATYYGDLMKDVTCGESKDLKAVKAYSMCVEQSEKGNADLRQIAKRVLQMLEIGLI